MPKSLQFKLDETPKCPHCNKELDAPNPARDFVVWQPGGRPAQYASDDSCGWCDGNYSAQVTAPDTITFTAK